MFKRLKAPLDTQIEVTSACPHACRHCYNYWRADSQHPPYMLGEKSGRAIIDRLAAAGVLSIVLTGGEPLLNVLTCLACLECAREYGMRVAINSNLVLLTDETVGRLRSAGLEYVLTSICGPDAALHDHITQRPGSFDRLTPRPHPSAGRSLGIKFPISAWRWRTMPGRGRGQPKSRYV